MSARPPSLIDRFFDAASPLDVLRALRALDGVTAGRIDNGATMNDRGPHRGGVLCPVVFGPLQDGCCNCGSFGGPNGRAPVSTVSAVPIVASRPPRATCATGAGRTSTRRCRSFIRPAFRRSRH